MSHERCAIRRSVINRYVIILFTTVAAMLWMPRPAWAQCEAGQLTSPEGGEGDGFAGVALDGDVAVVSDPLAFGFRGAVFVYRRESDDPGDWVLEQMLMAPEPDVDDQFGRVAIDGNVILATAPNADVPEVNRGTAYVYRYDPASRQWQFEQQLLASDGEGGDLFGWSLAIDGDAILIGARDDVVNGVSQAGSAYVFRYNSQTKQWIEDAKLTDPEGEQLDLFGKSVSIKGDIALVGAHANDAAGLSTGAAFVFRNDPPGSETWVFQQQLNAFDAKWPAWFGWSVNLSGDLALITAPQENDQTGAAYVFRDTGKRWVHEIKLTAADPVGPFPFFGRSGSISGDTIIIGAPSDFALGAESGAAHLFRENRIGWEEVLKLTASDGQAGDFFGAAVVVSGDVAFISAPHQSAPSTVYVFDLDPALGDLDCDGQVGVADLLALLMNWGPCDDCNACIADLDGNCIVGVSDLLILLANWG